ncbi:MAG: ribonuclease III [Kiritimatiellaeota bacterium]|nr:ribonuclease III [Kiritimatiellota bacterium]
MLVKMVERVVSFFRGSGKRQGSPKREKNASALAALERTLGYAFKDRALLETALTTPSFRASSSVACVDNQRLEFLGDAVIGLLAAEHLFNTHQDADEGVLTKRRSHLTSGSALAQLARQIGLGNYLRVGRGDRQTGGVGKERLLADAMEAVIGAVWCDGEMAGVRALFRVLITFGGEVSVAKLREDNPKGHLQEIAQRLAWAELPSYDLVSVTGPNHAPAYVVRVRVEGGLEATGEGTTKRAATVTAARRMLEKLKKDGVE